MGNLSEEGTFSNDKKIGKWTEYITIGNRFGEILSETDYSNNVENGTYNKFFDIELITDTSSDHISHKIKTTRINESFSYKNGLKTGNYILKDSLNNIKIEGQYLNDLETGVWNIYDENNNIYCKINYLKGKINYSTYFYNNEKYLTKMFENEDLKELEYYKNSKLLEKHIIISKISRYVINVVNYESIDTIYSYTYIINSEEEYNYNLLKKHGIKQGEYIMKVNNIKTIIGQYNSNLKSGIWIYNYPSQNAYVKKEFKSGKIITELFYDTSENQLLNGELTINIPNNHKENIRIKKGLRNGKTRFINENNEEYEVIKYKKGLVKN